MDAGTCMRPETRSTTDTKSKIEGTPSIRRWRTWAEAERGVGGMGAVHQPHVDNDPDNDAHPGDKAQPRSALVRRSARARVGARVAASGAP